MVGKRVFTQPLTGANRRGRCQFRCAVGVTSPAWLSSWSLGDFAHMNTLLCFALFGGGFATGFILLIIACFTRRKTMKTLCIASLIVVGLQSLSWMWGVSIASVADQGDNHTPVSFWFVISIAAFGAAVLWSLLLFRFCHNDVA